MSVVWGRGKSKRGGWLVKEAIVLGSCWRFHNCHCGTGSTAVPVAFGSIDQGQPGAACPFLVHGMEPSPLFLPSNRTQTPTRTTTGSVLLFQTLHTGNGGDYTAVSWKFSQSRGEKKKKTFLLPCLTD